MNNGAQSALESEAGESTESNRRGSDDLSNFAKVVAAHRGPFALHELGTFVFRNNGDKSATFYVQSQMSNGVVNRRVECGILPVQGVRWFETSVLPYFEHVPEKEKTWVECEIYDDDIECASAKDRIVAKGRDYLMFTVFFSLLPSHFTVREEDPAFSDALSSLWKKLDSHVNGVDFLCTVQVFSDADIREAISTHQLIDARWGIPPSVRESMSKSSSNKHSERTGGPVSECCADLAVDQPDVEDADALKKLQEATGASQVHQTKYDIERMNERAADEATQKHMTEAAEERKKQQQETAEATRLQQQEKEITSTHCERPGTPFDFSDYDIQEASSTHQVFDDHYSICPSVNSTSKAPSNGYLYAFSESSVDENTINNAGIASIRAT